MLVAFSVTPIGTSEAVGEAVAEAVRVVRVVRDSGLPNRTDANAVSAGSRWGIQALAAAMASQHTSSIVATCVLSATASDHDQRQRSLRSPVVTERAGPANPCWQRKRADSGRGAASGHCDAQADHPLPIGSTGSIATNGL